MTGRLICLTVTRPLKDAELAQRLYWAYSEGESCVEGLLTNRERNQSGAPDLALIVTLHSAHLLSLGACGPARVTQHLAVQDGGQTCGLVCVHPRALLTI